MSTARHLRVVDENGEVFESADAQETIKALEAALTRAQRTINALRADQAAGRQKYEKRAVIVAAYTDWQAKMVRAGHKGKARCKLSDDRFDAMKAMIEAGYTLDDFELANTGLAAAPFVVFGKRRSTGPKDAVEVDLEYVCSKARRFEEAARIGFSVARAREEAPDAA